MKIKILLCSFESHNYYFIAENFIQMNIVINRAFDCVRSFIFILSFYILNVIIYKMQPYIDVCVLYRKKKHFVNS